MWLKKTKGGASAETKLESLDRAGLKMGEWLPELEYSAEPLASMS